MARAALRRRSTILSVAARDKRDDAGEEDADDGDDVEDGDRVETVPDAATNRGVVELELDARERVLLLALVAAPSGEMGLLLVDVVVVVRMDSDLVLRGDVSGRN